MSKSIEHKLKELPSKPGVYIFKDQAGMILYVGKAIKLKNRVSSYFKKDAGGGSRRIQIMISQIADFDYVITDNEIESLILENNFIKQHKPKYNIQMRDDKNYLFIKINLNDAIPTIGYERKLLDKKSKYFGPYTSSVSIKDTLRLVRRIFPYCANSKVGIKPCFYYHIGKCPGVCFGKISQQEYIEMYIKKIIQFLEGRQVEILKSLQKYMKDLARDKQFEKAARIRDQIFALNRVLERQKLVYPKKIDQDVFSIYEDAAVCINLFIIREGKLVQKENFILENAKQSTPQDILGSFLEQYYLEATNLPKEIMLPTNIECSALDKLFQAKAKHKLNIIVPSRGEKLQLMKLGIANAKQYLENQTDKHLLEEAKLLSSLRELQRVLNLQTIPARMECFDISNIQGTNAVGSMVVFDFGKPQKNQYRKFKINIKQTPDDFAMMKEMLERRFKRSLSENSSKWPLPDLIIVDGGKGQLSTAVKVLQEFNLNIPIIGLAKRLEEIFTTGKIDPLMLPVNSIALFLLQRIRDEAHRFAITYHRKLRSKSSVRSALDSIPGIGPSKKKKLLEKFGSITNIRAAGVSEIASVIGTAAAEKIKATL